MEPYILLAVVVFGLIVAGMGIVFAVSLRSARTVQRLEVASKRPQGYWIGVGMAVGMLIGSAFTLIAGVLTDATQAFMIFGPAAGMLFGLAIGTALEEQHKGELRPPTPAEQRARRWALLAGVALLGLVALAALVLVLVLVGA